MVAKCKIGLFGIGLDTYWPQFEGLEARLVSYLQKIEQRISIEGVEVVSAGLVDNTDKAFEAGTLFRKEDVEIVFLYVSTYALSSTVLPVVQKSKVPIVILNFSPTRSIDFRLVNGLKDRTKMTGEWLSFCNACPVPEISNVLKRCQLPFYEIVGTLENNDHCWNEISQWIQAAKVKSILNNNRLGVMGHYYSGMLDIYTDLTTIYRFFGGHIEHLEVEDLVSLRNIVTESEIKNKLLEFNETFEIQSDCSSEDLRNAATTSVALDKMVDQYKLGGMAYYYKGTGNISNENAIASIILGTSLLTKKGVPVAGEYEVKNAQAMKIMDSFGAGGSFTEYYGIDFNEDFVLMGHDGPGHVAISEGKTKVKPLKVYHGKVGKGLSVEMSVKNGPVTLLSIVEDNGGLMMLCAEGDSVPGEILEIGNTNSRYRFSIGATQFMKSWNAHGPAHHCAVGVGHIGSKIEKLANLLAMRFVKVC
jgi:L-arabinose isomerase